MRLFLLKAILGYGLMFFMLFMLTACARAGVKDRNLVDRPDDKTGYQLHVLYVVPQGGDDQNLDTNGTLASSMAAMNHWLEAETGQTFKVDTYQGEIDITYFELNRDEQTLRRYQLAIATEIEVALQKAGFHQAKKLYVAYYEGRPSRNICGQAAQPPELTGNVAVVYLSACNMATWPVPLEEAGLREFVLVHEVFHLLGAVPSCAPNTVGNTAHTTDSLQDLMAPGISDTIPKIDVGRNDYFQHENRGCLDLSDSVFLEPEQAYQRVPPGWHPQGFVTRLIDTTALSSSRCSQVDHARPQDSDNRARLRFINQSAKTLSGYWIDYYGQRKLKFTLEPGQFSELPSFATHPWLIVDEAGNCVELYYALEKFNLIMMTD